MSRALLAFESISKWDRHMVQNNLRLCYMGNMVKLFLKECVCHPLCCHRTAYQCSSSLSHLCHLIFIPIKPLFHISFLSLSCLSLLLFPRLCVWVSPVFAFHSWSACNIPVSSYAAFCFFSYPYAAFHSILLKSHNKKPKRVDLN